MSEMLSSTNKLIYPTQYLCTSTFRIRRTNWVFIRNVTAHYTFILEPYYDSTRTNNFLFNDFYGNLYIDYFRIITAQGSLSDYLRIRGAQATLSGLQQYGSMHGVMKFLSTDRVDVYFNSSTATSTWYT